MPEPEGKAQEEEDEIPDVIAHQAGDEELPWYASAGFKCASDWTEA